MHFFLGISTIVNSFGNGYNFNTVNFNCTCRCPPVEGVGIYLTGMGMVWTFHTCRSTCLILTDRTGLDHDLNWFLLELVETGQRESLTIGDWSNTVQFGFAQGLENCRLVKVLVLQ
jgi:hypothetical protein